MTKEQEEAIERLKGMIKSYIEADECGLSNNDFKHEIRAMQTVLNMLKEKDKEIKTLKRDFKIVDQECSRLERKEAKQDKIIDLMVEKINQAYCQENDFWKWFEENFGIRSVGNYTKELKQYFESKVEE